jgi:hypothetical protein
MAEANITSNSDEGEIVLAIHGSIYGTTINAELGQATPS